MDFRDPWTLQFPAEDMEHWAGRWNRRLEASVLRRAGRVVCNTDALARGLREAYPHLPEDRFVVITNGFDPADFPEDPPPPPATGPFVFLHTGEFFPVRRSRVPDPFLELKPKTTEVDNLLDWAVYTDWRIDPDVYQDDFSDFFSDLDFKPRSWLTLTSEIRYDLEETQFQIANHAITFTPNNVWSWAFGHRYMRDDFELGLEEGHDLLFSTFYYRFNENWGFRASHQYELEDRIMQEQYYTLYRDLRSFTAALTFRVIENRDEPIDFGVAVTFSLKAYPRYEIGDDRNYPSLLLGG